MSFKRSKSYNLRRVDLLVKNNNKKQKYCTALVITI